MTVAKRTAIMQVHPDCESGDPANDVTDLFATSHTEPIAQTSVDGVGTYAVGRAESASKHGTAQTPRRISMVVSFGKITVLQDISQFEGSAMEKVETMASRHAVMIFGTSHCPFCLELVRMFAEMGITIHVVEADTTVNGFSVLSAAKKLTRHRTVPITFINGEFVGGCDEVKALQLKGLLDDKLHAAGLRPHRKVENPSSTETIRLVQVARGRARHPLCWFPNVVNNNVVRLTGTIVAAVCAVSIIFRNDPMGKWCAVGLLIDFTLRFLVGSSLSPIGMLAGLLTSPWKPDFTAGPPKQFAAACGITFSLTATVLFFTHHILLASTVCALLLAAAAMEGLLDFCLGCVFFSLAVRFRLIPPHLYRIYVNTREESSQTWDYEHLPSRAPPPAVPLPLPLPGPDPPRSSGAAPRYKIKTEEWSKDDFHLVRNMQVTYFAMPMALAALALAFKLAAGPGHGRLATASPVFRVPRSSVQAPAVLWHVTGVTAGCIFALLLCLYLSRVVLYPRKCCKEWACPRRSPCFSAVPLCLLLLAFLATPHDTSSNSNADINISSSDASSHHDADGQNEVWEWAARGLFWVGAGLQSVVTVTKWGEFVGTRLETEHLHPTWMMTPLGCLAAAAVAPVVTVLTDSEATEGRGGVSGGEAEVEAVLGSAEFVGYELARAFLAFGAVMGLVVLGITLNRTLTGHNSDNGLRHSAWLWVGGAALASVASLHVCIARSSLFSPPGNAHSSELTELGACSDAMATPLWVAFVLWLSLGWASLPYIGFFGRDRFSMAYWTECFATAVLAAAMTAYATLHVSRFSQILSLLLLAVASIFSLVALLWTLAQLYLRRTVFTPEPKWGPLAFMKLTHEAIRAWLPTFKRALAELSATDVASVHYFAALFSQFAIVHEEHSRHEDVVIFKAFDDLFPDHARPWHDDHDRDRDLFARWRASVDSLLCLSAPEVERSEAAAALRSEVSGFLEHFLEHVQGEEDHLSPIGKRYIPLEWQKQISRQVWELTPACRWEVMVPFLVNHLPRHVQRVRYLRALTWAMPERAQQIGAMVHRNVDAVRWETLRLDVPHMVPRGVPYWRRYY